MSGENFIGQRFGMLTVISRAPNGKGRKHRWFCQCDCGKEKKNPVTTCDLKAGKVRSCGCIYFESNKGRTKTHGMKGTRIYSIWSSMKRRCICSERYTSRGIAVCEQWANDFISFRDWALENGYADNLPLDRIDNEKGYSPDNCRWVTMKIQQNNRTNNHMIIYNGEWYTLAELSRVLGVPYATLARRVKNGWKKEEWAMPVDLANKHIRRRKHECS